MSRESLPVFLSVPPEGHSNQSDPFYRSEFLFGFISVFYLLCWFIYMLSIHIMVLLLPKKKGGRLEVTGNKEVNSYLEFKRKI